jgi:NTE family protein
MRKTAKTINLALQGGGSHGAYTWGVLDRLLQEDKLSIDGISGASAGAMNAIALAQGYASGGRDGARQALAKMWEDVSEMHALSPVQRTPLDALLGNWSMNHSPSYVAYDLLSRVASPYQTNPLGINPLRVLLKNLVDFKALRACKEIQLFISATNVRTGRARVFGRDEITADVLAASACLPTMFHAVKIKGEYYWDGGFMGNPVLWPLIYNCQSRDIVVVQINPVTRPHVPRSAAEIANRVSEITFNASLMSEMRAIAFVAKQLNEGSLDRKRYRKMLVHRIHSEAKMDTLDASSKMNAEWDFLMKLKKWGSTAADNWLRAHWSKLGRSSSVNIQKEYL